MSQVKPKNASTLAYLGQTLLQSIQLAENEYINACGTSTWLHAVQSSVDDNYARSRRGLGDSRVGRII